MRSVRILGAEMTESHDTYPLAIGFDIFRVRFGGERVDEMVEELLPLVASFVPNPQRTSSARGRAAWHAYADTESGALHACCLERLERDPGATITLSEAAAIVRAWLDPVRAEPIFTGDKIARHWLNLPEMDAGAWEELRFFIAASKISPIFWKAVELIAERRLRTDQPLGDHLRLWLADMLAEKARKRVIGRVFPAGGGGARDGQRAGCSIRRMAVTAPGKPATRGFMEPACRL